MLLMDEMNEMCKIFVGVQEQIHSACRAKADMKTETDKFKLAVLDGRQMALKVSANRCGSAHVEIRCTHGCATVCSRGAAQREQPMSSACIPVCQL